jgi:hypothetical protein
MAYMRRGKQFASQEGVKSQTMSITGTCLSNTNTSNGGNIGRIQFRLAKVPCNAREPNLAQHHVRPKMCSWMRRQKSCDSNRRLPLTMEHD